MKSTIAFLLSLGLFVAVTPLHADSSSTKSDTTSTSGGTATDKGEKDKGTGGAEPECN